MPIRIVIFEDNDKLREALSSLISCTEGYETTGHYNNCNEADTIVMRDQPDIVLMDIDMPGYDGIQGVKIIKATRPETSIIMYTVFEDDEKLFQCLCAGANGYVLKKTPPAKLMDAIHEVLEGGAPMSPIIAKKVLASFQHKKNNDYQLTPREQEVLQLLIKGYSTKMIAAELQISFDTANSHLKNIYPKLHVNCGKEAIAKAIKERII